MWLLPSPYRVPVKCSRCGAENTSGQRYCRKCGAPLDPREIAQSSIEIEILKKRLAALGDLEKRQEETEKIIGELKRMVEGRG